MNLLRSQNMVYSSISNNVCLWKIPYPQVSPTKVRYLWQAHKLHYLSHMIL